MPSLSFTIAFFFLIFQIGPKKQTLAISRLFILYKASIVKSQVEICRIDFFRESGYGRETRTLHVAELCAGFRFH